MGDNSLPIQNLMANSVENSIRVIWGLLVRVVLVAFTIYFIWRVRSTLTCVLVAVFLTYALLPGVEWLCRIPVRWLRPKPQRLIAAILVFCAFMAFIAVSFALFITPFKAEVQEFSMNVEAYSTQTQRLFKSALDWYQKYVPADAKKVVTNLDYSKFAGSMTDYAKRVLTATTSWISFAVELILIPVMAFYFVWDYRSLTHEIYGLVPRSRRRDAVRIGRDVGEILQSYIIGQFILCAIAGILTGLFLSILGIPYVVVLALFSGITRAIPVIGPVVSGIPIVLMGVLYANGNMTLPIYLMLFVIIMHFAESKFIMPRLIGQRMRLHPAVVIIVLLIGAEFFGLLGMFLAAPVAAIIRDLIKLYYVLPRDRARKAALAEAELAPLIER